MEPVDDVVRGLLGAAPDALLAVEADGSIAFANDQVEQLFGWPRAELVGRSIETLVPARYAAAHPALRTGYMARPSTRPMGAGLELWARRRDGTEFPAEISLSSFSTSAGPLVAAAIRDVSFARRSEQRFRAVLASAPDAIIGVDVEGWIEIVNAQAERLFGWTADELLGRSVESLVPEGRRGPHVGHRLRYVADPQARPMGAGLQLSAQRKDGTTFPAEISLSAITDDRGQPLVLAAVRDVTERLEIEAERQRQAFAVQREQSHRMESLGQLAGGVAHDFNNLLGVILNYVTLVARRVDDAVALADLAEIRGAAERAAALTRQLLTFARRDVTRPESLEVNEVVRNVAAMLDRTLGEHIQVRLDLATTPLLTVADRHQLEQIVLNLAINARDAMSDGGELQFRTEAVDLGAASPGVRLAVSDEGHGMAADVAARAFEPFFTTKPTGEGTGLGLATVYGIVRQNGGEVRLDSSEGVGTTVVVDLPGASGAPAELVPAPVESGGAGQTILLVEDEPALRRGTARMLLERGYQVVTAENGVDALALLEEGGRVDVVISDVAMPRMRGDELARRLSDARPELPVILVSGYESGGVDVTGPVLAKPVPEEDLLRAIREVLGG